MVLAHCLSRFSSRKENSLIELHQNIQHISFTLNIMCKKYKKKTKFYTNLTQENPTDYVQNKNAEIEK